MTENPFEIPQALRDVAEQNMKQAHAAYEQLTDFVTKALAAWTDAMPASPMAAPEGKARQSSLPDRHDDRDSSRQGLSRMAAMAWKLTISYRALRGHERTSPKLQYDYF